MKEHELYPAVKAWLDANGYEVHVEIFDCDIVAVKDGRLTVFELKVRDFGKATMQAARRTHWCDEVVIVVPQRPKHVSGIKYSGYGLMLVQNAKARMAIWPRQQPYFREKQRAYRFKRLAARSPAQPHEVAGLPASKRLKEQRRRRVPTRVTFTFDERSLAPLEELRKQGRLGPPGLAEVFESILAQRDAQKEAKAW